MAQPGRSPLGRVKLSILAITLLLTAVGILFVHSTTAVGADFPSRRAALQIVKAAVALGGLIIITRIDYRILDRHAYVIYGAVCLLLAGMLAYKLVAGGRNRFIDVHLFQVQPSELMKIGLIAALASYLRFRESQRQVFGLIGPLSLTLLPMALVLFQPNLGLSLMFPPILLAVLFVAGAKARYLYFAVLAVVLSLAAAYFLSDHHLTFLKPYQRDRIKAFLVRDSSTARNEGLQLHQSLIAVGSGGTFGKGYGEGTQNTLEYLPEKETDFIFSIIAEETGFAGACTVVVLLFSLAALILKVAVHTREPFGRLVATGIATVFAAQSFENIGMTLGLTPITGIALPFLSLAGSNLVASYLAIGIVINIASSSVPVVATKDLDPQDSKGFQVVVEDRAAALLQTRWPVE